MSDVVPPSFPPSAPELAPGRKLGDFIVHERLASGGFGSIYRAEQPMLAREAVIKVLHESHQRAAPRFLREARLASKLDHPFTAHIYAFGAEPDGLLWIAMERVKGTPLNQLLAEGGPLPLNRFVPFFEKLCEVVHTAHLQGITHRDLKPANVMVLSRAETLLPKLLDLGIAKLRDNLSSPAEADDPFALAHSRLSSVPSLSPSSLPTQLPEHTARPTVAASIEPALTADLTQHELGGVMGSPHYMAPEQWVNAASANARTDIYALGILAYQCLTARLPFEGTTVRALATAHAKQSLPELPPYLSGELTDVLRKATAKRPGDRFASAVELARALRVASHLTEDTPLVPQLEPETRELFISDAPQPIAEAVALLEAAKRPARAVSAAQDVLSVTVRYLGILALAARARVGPGGMRDAPAVVTALQQLCTSGLDDRGWWTLTEELLRPFAQHRDAHPLPDLVALFADPKEGLPFATLLSQLEDAVGAAREKGEDAIEALTVVTRLLSQLLSRLFFVNQFRLLLARGARAEEWTGLRRIARKELDVMPGAPQAGNFYLSDGNSTVVLHLSPFVQAIAPAPGATLEPFFLDGSGRSGARLTALPVRFERHDEALWSWFQANVLDVIRDGEAADARETVPYLGLSSFTAAEAGNFFGREKEAEGFANRLRVQPLVAVVGPSGAGKSSFLQAGALPLLSGWRAITARPGRSPFLALATLLSQEGILPEDVSPDQARQRLRDRPELLAEWLAAHARRGQYVRLLIVDQFEELITLCADDEERQKYAEALAGAALGEDQPVRVVLAFRDDFLIRLQRLRALRDKLAEGLQLLGTPASEDLLRILVKPAERAHYGFEDESLPVEMVREVENLPGALALLSFTASRLWELRDRQLRRLTRRAYKALGGVGGALAHHAESTLSALSEKEQALVREAFRHLVTAEGTRAVVSRHELYQLLGGSQVAAPLLEKLIVARLLVSSEAGGAEDRIEVIHEALLSSWPRLVQWQREDAENARMRDNLRQAARQWAERGRPRGLLWRKEPLLEYKVWRSRYSGLVTEVEAAFAGASLREEARSRNLRQGLLLGSFLGLLVVLAVVTRAQRRASKSALDAQQRLAELHSEQGRLASLDGKPLEALTYLDAAFKEGIRGPAIDLLVSTNRRLVEANRLTMLAHQGSIIAAELDADERLLVTSGTDGAAGVWDMRTGQRVARLAGPPGTVYAARFTPDGSRLITGHANGTLHVWDARTWVDEATLECGPSSVLDLDISPDGRWVAASLVDPVAYVFDLATLKPLQKLESPTRISQLRFSPDGSLLVGSVGFAFNGIDGSGDIPVWPVGTWKRETFSGHKRSVRWVTFSRDGSRLASVSDDGTGRVWDVRSRKQLTVLAGHTGVVLSVSFSPDGSRVVTSGADASARVWETSTGALRTVLDGHTDQVPFVSFAANGTKVVTASDDASVRLWDANTGAALWPFAGHVQPILGLRVNRAGSEAVTFGSDGVVKVWSLNRERFKLVPPGTLVNNFELERQGSAMLLQPLRARSLEVWDGTPLRRKSVTPVPIEVDHFSWSSASGRVAVSDSVEVRVLRLPEGTELLRAPPPVPDAKFGTVTALSLDGSRMAVGHWSQSRVDLWDVERKKTVGQLQADGTTLSAMAVAGDGFVTGTSGGAVTSWDREGRKKWSFTTVRSAEVKSLAISRDERFVAAGTIDRSITVWDAKTGATLAFTGRQGGAYALAFSRDGAFLAAVGLAPYASVWETERWKRVADLPTGSPQAALGFDGANRLYTLGQERPTAVWDLTLAPYTEDSLSRFVRCRVPFVLAGERLEVSLREDPTCADQGKF